METSKKSTVKTFWPVSAALGMPLLLIVLTSTPFGTDFAFVMIGIPVLLCLWACLSIWALVVSIQHLRHREWLLTLASAVLPLFVVGCGSQFWRFLHLCNYGGDIVNFIAMRSSYLERIRAVPRDGKPLLLVLNRGGMVWASRGYVYDESDELVRADSLRSVDWKMQADQTELRCGFVAEPFPGHFSFTKHWYIASFNC